MFGDQCKPNRFRVIGIASLAEPTTQTTSNGGSRPGVSFAARSDNYRTVRVLLQCGHPTSTLDKCPDRVGLRLSPNGRIDQNSQTNRGSAVPRIRVPENVGECEVVVAMAGNYAVCNRKSGKNRLWIVCRDREQAEEVLRRIKEHDHDGELWV